MKHFAHAVVLVTLGLAAATAQAQDPTGTQQHKGTTAAPQKKEDTRKEASKSELSAADRQFIIQVAQDGMGEVEMGKLAASKAVNADVKKFGQRMVDEHTKANDELKSLADKKNLPVPNELTKLQKATHDRLDKLAADKFDRAVMAQLITDHKKDVALFQKHEKTAKDADLKQWVTKMLPTLQDHLKQAQTIDNELRAPPSPKTSQR